MRQIKTRQLVRRCPACRKLHTGPVSIAESAPRKTAKKKITGRKARPASRRPEPPDRITLIEVRSADVLPEETPAPAETYRDALGLLY
jgi:hypothetical protein